MSAFAVKPGNDRRRILVVDSSQTVLAGIARQAVESGDVAIETFTDPQQALAGIRQHPPDALVTEYAMTAMSGHDLAVRAREIVPQLPVIFTVTEHVRVQAAEAATEDAAQVLEKPYSLPMLVRAVDRALAEPEGFAGEVLLPMLPDLIQLYSLSRVTGNLSILHIGDRGDIWFESGAIVHAAHGTLSGEEAFYDLLTWHGGTFALHPGAAAPVRTIRASCEELLLEGCRRMDDRNHAHDDEPFPDEDWAAPGADDRPSETIDQVVKGGIAMGNLKQSLDQLAEVDGFIGACVVDSNSGMMLGAEGNGAVNLELAAAGNTDVVRAKRKTMASLGLKDNIEDILITLGKQYHLIRPSSIKDGLFIYLVLDKSRSNLALARHRLADVEKSMVV